MNTQSNAKTKRLAITSLILGILSSGLFLFACLILLWVKLSPSGGWGEFGEIAMGIVGLALLLILGSSALGIPGLIIGFSVLLRIKKDGDVNKIMGITILSLVLNGLGVTVFLIYLAYIFVLNPPHPPPVEITPFSPIPPTP